MIIQRRLRQWFWWQHPGLKDICDSLFKYLRDEGVVEIGDGPLTTIGFDDPRCKGIEQVARILVEQLLPPLLPPSLARNVDVQILTAALLLEDW